MQYVIAVCVVLLGWGGVARAANPYQGTGALQALSVVYFAATDEVYLSLAFYENPFTIPRDPPDTDGFALRSFSLRIFFDNRPHSAHDVPEWQMTWNPPAPAAGLALRLPFDLTIDPPRALLPFVQSHDGTVLSLRFPLTLLGDADGKFWVEGIAPVLPRFGVFVTPALCDGLPPDVIGTAGNDVLFAPEVANNHPVVMGLAGNDLIYGAEHDHLCGGPGDDQLHGGEHADRLFGEEGNDILYGEWRNDYLSGGPGNDILIGGEGPDRLMGGPGIDLCIGGAVAQPGDSADASCELVRHAKPAP